MQDDIDNIIEELREDLEEFDDANNDSDADEWKIPESSQNDVDELLKYWVSERAAPEILEFQKSLLDRIMFRVRRQIEFIEMNSMDLQPEKDIKFKLLIVESELERIKFVVRNYLRTRLSKIDKYTLYIKSNERLIQRLSREEIEYMNDHYDLLHTLYKDQFLSALPQSLQKIDDTSGGVSMIEEPNMDAPVFIRVNKTVEFPIKIDDDEVDLIRDNIYVLRYSKIRRLMDDNSVVLI
ncbi:subunit of the GINS complex [Nadsonia fulvescens var. elongata DSM 6958]|uniref:DNA replication complex GINS protein SLD5 n=1 Tax=Nadsonia fulvescens var. elongata DSM 6958 TaxID=857566 RepID=A0A1E3PF99_9ASCO|nr:subunit of the GINS complex [Nadsonia fulvescens var. elongata DSM 6958]